MGRRLIELVPLDSSYADVWDADECRLAGAHWATHGFGPWAAHVEDRFAGVAEVHYAYPGVTGIGTDEIEVGWTVVDELHGRGIATEMMSSAIADAWTRARADCVVAYIRPENEVSHRVAEKLGMRPRGEGLTRSGDPMTVYELRRPILHVARRELHRGRVWRIGSALLVARHGDHDVLWHPAQTPALVPMAGERKLRIPGDEEWTLEPMAGDWSSLGFVRPGTRHSVWILWRDGRLDNWYVNFERESAWNGPFLDYVDEKLDFVVLPDGTVRWKDEDELAQAAAVGHVDEVEVRAEAARVLADPPWPTGWESFEPDPSWPMPQLPEGWSAA